MSAVVQRLRTVVAHSIAGAWIVGSFELVYVAMHSKLGLSVGEGLLLSCVSTCARLSAQSHQAHAPGRVGAAHLRVEVQHDADDLVCDVVGDLLSEEDDALAIQPVVQVHLWACGCVAYKHEQVRGEVRYGRIAHPVGLVGTGRSVRHLREAPKS